MHHRLFGLSVKTDEKTILPGTIVPSGQIVPYLICLFAQLDVLYSDTSSYAISRVEVSKAAESTGQPPNCVNYHRNHNGPSSQSRHHSQVPSFSSHVVACPVIIQLLLSLDGSGMTIIRAVN